MFDDLVVAIEEEISAAQTIDEINQLEKKHLGKESTLIKAISQPVDMSMMREVFDQTGIAINRVKTALEEKRKSL